MLTIAACLAVTTVILFIFAYVIGYYMGDDSVGLTESIIDRALRDRREALDEVQRLRDNLVATYATRLRNAVNELEALIAHGRYEGMSGTDGALAALDDLLRKMEAKPS